MDEIKLIFFAGLGGILPAFIWLWFWLREDSANPEPRRVIIITFLFGMLTVLLVLPIEKLIKDAIYFPSLFIVILLALIEESFKLFFAWFTAIKKKECDEAIDPMIYLITIALGFASLENAFFLWGINEESFFSWFITGNLRFIGASLLHVLASSTIGLFLAFSWHKTKKEKTFYTALGLITAVALHTFFNLFIIFIGGHGLMIALIYVWVLTILLLLAFEKVKRLKKNPN